MLPFRILKFKSCVRPHFLSLSSKYSRKSFNEKDYYPVIRKTSDSSSDLECNHLATNQNWELLSPQGFRFFLPGSVGPAWQDGASVAFIPSLLSPDGITEMECDIHDCPSVLRQGIAELFPAGDMSTSQLTVVTLSLRKDEPSSEMEIEQFTKQFMWMAHRICDKLKVAGYWADFINPFSGIPFLTPSPRPTLYTTDESFRCLGFNINSSGPCTVVSKTVNNNLTGSLFTSASSHNPVLRDILKNIAE